MCVAHTFEQDGFPQEALRVLRALPYPTCRATEGAHVRLLVRMQQMAPSSTAIIDSFFQGHGPSTDRCPATGVTAAEMTMWLASPILLLHVPKTGGTFIRQLLVAAGAVSEHTLSLHIPAVHYAECVPTRYFARRTVAIVRSPWDRIASAFLYHANIAHGHSGLPGLGNGSSEQSHTDTDATLLYWRRRLANHTFSSFVLELLRDIVAEDGKAFHSFAAQHTFINNKDGLPIVDEVVRYEDVLGSPDAVVSLLGSSVVQRGMNGQLQVLLPSGAPIDVPHQRWAHEGKYCYLYTPELADAVYRVYSVDVKQFGYRFPCADGISISPRAPPR